MIRQGFLLRLKPGGLEEYRRLHQQVPREVELDEEAAGVISEVIFEHDGMLFVYSVITDEGTWDRARGSEASRRWAETLTPFLEMGPDGTVASTALTEVYYHAPPTDQGPSSTTR